MEVDGEVVEDCEVGVGEEELEDAACPDPSFGELLNVSRVPVMLSVRVLALPERFKTMPAPERVRKVPDRGKV